MRVRGDKVQQDTNSFIVTPVAKLKQSRGAYEVVIEEIQARPADRNAPWDDFVMATYRIRYTYCIKPLCKMTEYSLMHPSHDDIPRKAWSLWPQDTGFRQARPLQEMNINTLDRRGLTDTTRCSFPPSTLPPLAPISDERMAARIRKFAKPESAAPMPQNIREKAKEKGRSPDTIEPCQEPEMSPVPSLALALSEAAVAEATDLNSVDSAVTSPSTNYTPVSKEGTSEEIKKPHTDHTETVEIVGDGLQTQSENRTFAFTSEANCHNQEDVNRKALWDSRRSRTSTCTTLQDESTPVATSRPYQGKRFFMEDEDELQIKRDIEESVYKRRRHEVECLIARRVTERAKEKLAEMAKFSAKREAEALSKQLADAEKGIDTSAPGRGEERECHIVGMTRQRSTMPVSGP